MNEIPYMDWRSSSDIELLSLLGRYIREHRLRQNRTQQEVSQKAGISRSTLSLLESGEPTSTLTLVRVLRILNVLGIWNQLTVQEEMSPLEYARSKRSSRQRARPDDEDQDPRIPESW